MKTAAERKRDQRKRWKEAGYIEARLLITEEEREKLEKFKKSLKYYKRG